MYFYTIQESVFRILKQSRDHLVQIKEARAMKFRFVLFAPKTSKFEL